MKKLIQAAIIPPALYVERAADRQLANIINGMGRPGYVLVARQMGKTNLVINAKRMLEAEDLRFVYVDCSNKAIDARSCFRGIVDRILQSHDDIASKSRSRIAASRAVESVSHSEHEAELLLILSVFPGKIVLVLDEIDALASSGFSDEIFAQIRSVYFSRITFPALERLTYVLSGVIEPSDLIKDPRRSPFNIGEKIFLEDFTLAETEEFILKAGLRIENSCVEALHTWTGGHPRLTWDICSELEDHAQKGGGVMTTDIDRIVRERYLTSFDVPPIDHIRQLASVDSEIRGAIRTLSRGGGSAIHEWIKKKLYLAGLVKFANGDVVIKGKAFAEALGSTWLDEVDARRDALPSKAFEHAQRGKYQEAANLYHEFLASRPDLEPAARTECFGQLGHCLRRINKFEEAIGAFGNCVYDAKTYPAEFYKTQFAVGLCLLSLTRHDEAAEVFRRIATDYRRSLLRCKALINLGATVLRKDTPASNAEAEQRFREALMEIGQLPLDDVGEIQELLLVACYNVSRLRLEADDLSGAREVLRQALNVQRPAYMPSLYLALLQAQETKEGEQEVAQELCKYIVNARLKFDGVIAESIEGSVAIEPFSVKVFFEICDELLSRSLSEDFSVLADYGFAEKLVKGHGRADLMASVAGYKIRTRDGATAIRVLETATSELRRSPISNPLACVAVYRWCVVAKAEQKAIHTRDVGEFVGALERLPRNVKLTGVDFLAFVYAQELLLKEEDWTAALNLARVFEKRLLNGGRAVEVNRFLIYVFRAIVLDRMGKSEEAFDGAVLVFSKYASSLESTETVSTTLMNRTLKARLGEIIAANPRPFLRSGVVPKVGRNAPCPCGSGEKYKNCHGS